jgi:proteic killer suppression protein
MSEHPRLRPQSAQGINEPGAGDIPAPTPLTCATIQVTMDSVIASFADRETAALFRRERVKRIDPLIQRAALRKLRYLDSAASLDDLRVPPGNRLEALKGERAGQHSIRVNDQWRIVFTWRDGRAHDVSVVDYH